VITRAATGTARGRIARDKEPVMSKRPGGEMSTRPLHFFWIADCSGSMKGAKIQTLNFAIRDAVPEMVRVADENPNAQVLVRAIKFSNGAAWHISAPTPIADFKWVDLEADGLTDMGTALRMVAAELKMPPMSERALPPVLVLISDGMPSDDFNGGVKALMDEPWGKKAVRIAVAIGEDASQEILQKFIGNPEMKPLSANNPEALVKQIRWVSTAVLKSASSPASHTKDASTTGGNVPVPVPIPAPDAGDAGKDVW
jgi:uncharacterized protein YegL